MKLVNPTIKYKDSYLELVKAAKVNGDISEMGMSSMPYRAHS